MGLNSYTLLEKKSLTSDIYELTFEAKEKFDFLPGQFITFILPGIGGRAYSILKTQDKKITLIIKKRSQKMGGRGGSSFICDLEIGSQLQGTNPSGKFLLQNNNKNKLFLGTGTGFVPLYNQIINSLEAKQDCKLELLFGARSYKDLFYLTQLEKLKDQYPDFSYRLYLSQEEKKFTQKGYVTEYLNKKNIEKFQEFYICGIPALIDNSLSILKNQGILDQNIFSEKY